jgi:Flp pilus assembly protein TadD
MNPPDMTGSLPPERAAGVPATLAVTVAEALALAGARFAANRLAEAESIALEVLATDPDQPEALQLCGAIAHLAGKSALALALLEKAHRLAPADSQILYNLGVVQGALGRRDAARAAYSRVIELSPGHVDALHNLGNLAFEDDDVVLAQACYARALALRPGDAQLHLAGGLLAMTRRDLGAAREQLGTALTLAPADAHVAWEAAAFFLLEGEYRRGWQLYEQRFAPGSRSQAYHYPFEQPLWRGESLRGRHLLVHGEQGLGDEIMFLSIVPELIAEGAHVTLVCQPQLAPLWRETFKGSVCHALARVDGAAWTGRPAAFLGALLADAPDFQIPCGSLPLWRRRAPADFARQQAFVAVAPELREQWRIWLESHGAPLRADRLRVGLVWAGHTGNQDIHARRKDARRSLTLDALLPLGSLGGVDWVSLQLGEASAAVASAAQGPVLIDASAGLVDFAQTAALVTNLDLVISVDTSVAHLAGAMGKAVWILLPFAGEWRWGLMPQRSAWWPSATLFRQARAGHWGDVVERVRAALADVRAKR